MNINNSIILVIGILAIGFLAYFVAGNTHLNQEMGNNMMDNDMNKEMEEHIDEKVADYEIYPSKVADKIKNKEDIILLDVRNPEEYKEIHLQNALLLPVQDLSQQSLNEIGLGEGAKDKEIYLYCRSGARSKIAYNIMTSLGYTNIKSVAGGMIHWQEDKYPYTEKGAYDGSLKIKNKDKIQDSQRSPKISLDSKSYNFGLIPQFGGVVEKTFTVKNTGKGVLKIGDLTTSCSCTSAKISSKEIKAGEQATLTVIFDPDFHSEPLGVFRRTVFIPTNDSSNPEAEISIQVDIDEGK